MFRLLVTIAFVLLAACSGDRSGHRRMTVVYASGADLQSINPLVTVHPLAKAVQKHVLFLTLASYDSLLRPVPRLSEWSWNEDRSTLSFELNSNVIWHDGTPTTAEDVAWTLRMAREPAVAYPRSRDLAAVIDVAVVDSLRLNVHFSRTQPVFPDVFTDLAILPAHMLEGTPPESVRIAEFNRAPVGNGPFEFVEHRPNQRWVFERSESFPAELGRPEIERFVVVVVDEPSTKLAALTSGELDFAGISPAHARFVEENEGLQTIDYPLQFSYALVWNLRRSPYDDLNVRRALSMAIDRELIVEAYIYGFGTVADGPVPPEHPWYVETQPVPFDPESAVQLLEENEWIVGEDGIRGNGVERLEVDLLTVGSGDAPLEQMIQAQLREVGVQVNIDLLELTSFLAMAQAGERDFDALVVGIPGDYSLSHVAAMFGGTNPGPLAYPGYESDSLDRLLDAASQATSEHELREAWQNTQRVLEMDLPTTWLYHARGLQGANRRIQNTTIDFRGELAGVAGWSIRRPN